MQAISRRAISTLVVKTELLNTLKKKIPPIVRPKYTLYPAFSECETLSPVKFKSNLAHLQLIRFKSKGKAKKIQSEPETGEETSDESEISDKNTKVIKINVATLRVDAILKSGFGIARNKIDTLFYESKIRVNGEKIPKKNTTVKEGDEIDIIKGFSQNNPEFLVVARLEILNMIALEDKISLKARRYKSLVIENYPSERWESSSERA